MNVQLNCEKDEIKEEHVIQLSEGNMVNATLPNKMKVLTLCDSGATRSCISRGVVSNSSYLMSRPISPIKPIKFQVGNGSHMMANSKISFEICMQGKSFKVEAVIVDHLGCMDLILGNNTLKELKSTLDFETNKLNLKSKSIFVKPAQNITLQPGQTKTLRVNSKLPESLKNAELFMQSSKFLASYSPMYMCVKMKRNNASIMVCNNTAKQVKISKQKPIGSILLKEIFNNMEPAKISTDKYHIMSTILTESTQTKPNKEGQKNTKLNLTHKEKL